MMKTTNEGQGTLKAKPSRGATRSIRTPTISRFSALGKCDDGRHFVKVAVGEKTALLDVDKIADSKSGELKKLTPLGASLIKQAARTEFLNRAHDATRQKPSFPSFPVGPPKTGKHGAVFVLPEGLDPRGSPNVERYFDEHYHQYHRRLHRAGTIRGWLQMADLCRGKTRLMTALCLSFSGAVCAEFGYEPPGYQLVSRAVWENRPSGASPGLPGAVAWILPAGSVAESVGTKPTSTSRSSRRPSIRCCCSSTTCTGPTRRTSRRSSRS